MDNDEVFLERIEKTYLDERKYATEAPATYDRAFDVIGDRKDVRIRRTKRSVRVAIVPAKRNLVNL